MSKQKKYTLTFDDEIDFDVFGISSPFADYRLAWELNGIMKIQLENGTKGIGPWQLHPSRRHYARASRGA